MVEHRLAEDDPAVAVFGPDSEGRNRGEEPRRAVGPDRDFGTTALGGRFRRPPKRCREPAKDRRTAENRRGRAGKAGPGEDRQRQRVEHGPTRRGRECGCQPPVRDQPARHGQADAEAHQQLRQSAKKDVMKRRHPLLREGSVRGLLRGEEVTYRGRVFAVERVRLDYRPPPQPGDFYGRGRRAQPRAVRRNHRPAHRIEHAAFGLAAPAAAIVRETAAAAGRPVPEIVQCVNRVARADRDERAGSSSRRTPVPRVSRTCAVISAAGRARRLARDAEAVCRHYLSNGHRQGRYWTAGDVMKTPGRSLFARLTGARFRPWRRPANGPPPAAASMAILLDRGPRVHTPHRLFGVHFRVGA